MSRAVVTCSWILPTARKCGVDLEAAFRQKRKEDIMIEKKLRELRGKPKAAPPALPKARAVIRRPSGAPIYTDSPGPKNSKKGMLHWLKRG